MELQGYVLPDELYYHEEHSWARIEEDGTVTVGMNDFFQKEAGDIVFVDMPEEDDEVEQGEVCGKIQSRKWIGKLCSPLSGEIFEVNEELEDEVTLINKDPYGAGWIFKMKATNLEEEKADLFHGESVEKWISEEIAKAEEEKAKSS